MTISLDELNNSNNLKDRHPSNALFTYYMPDSEDFMHFEPRTPQYKKLKNGEIVSLTLRITDQNNNIMTNGTGNNHSASYLIIKMYITINNIKGEKKIDLSYSIQNFDSTMERLGVCFMEIAVIRMLFSTWLNLEQSFPIMKTNNRIIIRTSQ